jgi:hypothetical protein
VLVRDCGPFQRHDTSGCGAYGALEEVGLGVQARRCIAPDSGRFLGGWLLGVVSTPRCHHSREPHVTKMKKKVGLGAATGGVGVKEGGGEGERPGGSMGVVGLNDIAIW